ncbi:MAG: hypothetical protein AB8G17_03710 [Gammaproteobacteria bacterium]
MRHLLLSMVSIAALAGCTGQQVKNVSGAVAEAALKETVYHASGARSNDEQACRAGGDRNQICENSKRQSFMGETPAQKQARAAAQRQATRDQAESFKQGWSSVRGTPNCVDDGVECDDTPVVGETIVKKKKPKRVVSRNTNDFTRELKTLLAQ